jgi:malate dehydrogenase
MTRVAIVGGGETGSLLAHVLARRHIASDICLIDDNGRAAEGKALDLTQAAPIERFAAAISGSADLSLVAGAQVVAVADPFAANPRHVDNALLLLKRIRDFAPAALIVCTSAADCDVIGRAGRERHASRSRLIGSAPEALVGGVRALAAIELAAAPSDISLSVLGVPPDHIVIPWEDATVRGLSMIRFLSEPARRRLDARAAAVWPPGPYALAAAAGKVIDAAVAGLRRLVACFVAPDDSAGLRARTAALPVRIGPAGVLEIAVPELNARERVRLENAMML